MAQATILAASTAAGTSTDVVVAAGSTVTIGLFTADAGGIPPHEGGDILIDTPGNDLLVVSVNGVKPVVQVSGPATYRSKKGVTSVALGFFSET